MRLLADVHISPATVRHLVRLGHDALRVTDRLSPSAADVEIVAVAHSEQRVIVTQDLDFTTIVALAGASGPSVITLRLVTPRVAQVNQCLERLLEEFEQELIAGVLLTADDRSVRLRHLPVR